MRMFAEAARVLYEASRGTANEGGVKEALKKAADGPIPLRL
jgi:hypothetical protein